MRPLRNAVVAASALLLPACFGQLENSPYTEPGTLRGKVSGEVDPSRAWAQIEGSPELWARVDADGHFSIAGVPPGPTTLLVSNGIDGAGRFDVLVVGGSSDEKSFALGPGGRIEGIVTLEGDDLGRWPDVGVAELPVREKAGREGRFSLRALPPGCYLVWARHLTHSEARAAVCLAAGEEASVALHLRALSGQDDGGGIDSGPGLERRPLCAPCSGGDECQSGLCVFEEDGPESQRVCSLRCRADEECPRGYACQRRSAEGRGVCLPAGLTCAEAANLGGPCNTDEECGPSGEATCRAGRCTVECESDRECMRDLRCVSTSGGRLCL